MKILYILTSAVIVFVLYSCSVNDKDILVSCDNIIVCSGTSESDQDSLYLILNFENVSNHNREVFVFFNPLDLKSNSFDEYDNNVMYSIMIEVDSNVLYFDPLFIKDGYVEIPPKEQVKLLFMTTSVGPMSERKEYVQLKEVLLHEKGVENITFSLIKFAVRSGKKEISSENDFVPSFDILDSKQILGSFDVVSLCNLSFQDKLNLVGGVVKYL